MRKLLCFLLISFIFFFPFCGRKEKKIERIIENGVEIIVNHLEPYQIKDEPITFSLEKEFVIDTERENLAELGIAEIEDFDVDSEGNIYILSPRSDPLILKFNKEGDFNHSFGRKGQGPGELQRPTNLVVTSQDEIAITDIANHRLTKFSQDGNLIEEIPISSDIWRAVPLENRKYIAMIRKIDASAKYFEFSLILYSSEFKKIKELDRMKYGNPIVGKSLKGIYHILTWSISNGKLFTGSQDRGYEIYVYDLDGNLLRKIKKEYKHLPVSDEYKKEYMKMFENPIFDPIRKKIYFPDSMPSFHSFFTDDEGRLFVMTYEKGKKPEEYIYDIFNAEGIFIGQKSLKIFYDPDGLYAKIKDGRFYFLNKKESGFQELVVCKVTWE